MNSLDARARYTRGEIRRCLLELLKKKSIEKITVTEICQMAQLNRATFYKHYLDVPDLLEKTENDLLEQLRAALGEAYSVKGITIESLCSSLERTLDFIRGGADEFMVLASDNADPMLPTKTFELVTKLFYPVFEKNMAALDEHKREMLYNYLTLGCGGVLMTWVRTGMRESSREIASFILTLSLGTSRSL